jgi:Tol biopolymer transport system component
MQSNIAWVFSIPLSEFDNQPNTTLLLQPVTSIKGNFSEQNQNGPTSADISLDGNQVAILNNNEIMIFKRNEQQSIVDLLTSGPSCITKLISNQNEGISFSADGKTILFNSELKNTGVNYLELIVP